MKYLLIIISILIVTAIGLFKTHEPIHVINEVTPNNDVKAAESNRPKDSELINSQSQTPTLKRKPVAESSSQVNHKTHLDKLSPEMQQAIKDRLLHSEPLDVAKDDKDRTVLKHNGRFTQMPVAVKQADGSVDIKEYSHIPEPK